MITAEKKDKLLIDLIYMGTGDHIINPKTFDMPYPEVCLILKQFTKRGFINSHDFSGLRFRVEVQVDAHDFIQRGGYKFEEDVFRNNFSKLELELAKLEKENPTVSFDNATKISWGNFFCCFNIHWNSIGTIYLYLLFVSA